MAKLILTDLTTNYQGLVTIQANFDAVVTELQDKVLYRDNPFGEPNTMEKDLDMNTNDVVNVEGVYLQQLYVNGELVDLQGIQFPRLGELLDVTTTTVSDGDTIVYNASLEEWFPGNPTSVALPGTYIGNGYAMAILFG